MDPVKVQAIMEWLTPKNKKEVQQFLGFLNFYRRFTKDFRVVVKQMMSLTSKEPWQWGETQNTAFNELKDFATSQPMLVLFKFGKATCIETDASTYGMGIVLSQKQSDDL